MSPRLAETARQRQPNRRVVIRDHQVEPRIGSDALERLLSVGYAIDIMAFTSEGNAGDVPQLAQVVSVKDADHALRAGGGGGRGRDARGVGSHDEDGKLTQVACV